MNWNEYYEGFATWEENDQIDNLLTVDSLGPADQVTDIIEDFAGFHQDIADLIARKAISQGIVFSARNIEYLTHTIDDESLEKLFKQSINQFSANDLDYLYGIVDDGLLAYAYKSKGYPLPREFSNYDESGDDNNESKGKKKRGFLPRVSIKIAIDRDKK